MGCCQSTPTTKPKSHKPNPDSSESKLCNRAPSAATRPPQHPVEEETVKEVLSETPFPKPPTSKPTNAYKNRHHLHPVPDEPRIQPTAAIRSNGNSSYSLHQQPPSNVHPVAEEQPTIQPAAAAAIRLNNNGYGNHQPANLLHPVAEQPTIQPTATIAPDSRRYHQPAVAEQPRIQPAAVVKPTEEIVSEVSDLSELYSYSESLSTVTENFIENEGEVTQRVHHRSPVKNARRKRPAATGGGRNLARRSDPSPVRRGQASQGRNVTPVRRNATPTRRNAGESNALRRESGEGSGRRSRSPATRGEGGLRRPVRSAGGQERRSRTPAGRRDDGDGGAVVPETEPAVEKSLDDPNVSLECFIFL